MSLSTPRRNSQQPGMTLKFRYTSLQDIVVQANVAWLRKYEIEIFQSLSKPEAFHFVAQCWLAVANIVNG